MASPFLQGFQVGANVASDKANRALRMQELQSQRQMRMLQEQNLAQQLALRAEERNLAIQERADMTKAIAAAQEATQPIFDFAGPEGPMRIGNPNPMTQEQAAMNFVLPVVAKYQPDKVPTFLQGVALAEYRKQTQAPFTPTEGTLPSGTRYVATSPNSVQVVGEKTPTSNERDASRISQLRQFVATEQDPAKKQFFQTQLDDMMALAMPSGTTMETVGPDGTTTRITTGRQPATAAAGGLTPTQRGTTKIQSDALIDTATRIGELASISDQLFGPQAAVANFVVDETLSNFIPSLAKGQRIQGRSKAALAREYVVRALGAGQGQLSNKDIDRLLKPFPKSGLGEVVSESPIDARNKLLSIQKEMARDAFQKSLTLGGEVPNQVLRMMDPAIVLQEFRNKRITAQQLQDAFDNSAHMEDAKAVLDSVQ